LYGVLIVMGMWLMISLFGPAEAGILSAQRRYGPSTPNGYYVRLEPTVIHMAHHQPSPVTVTVEDAAGQPVDDVLVRFTPSQGQVAMASNLTRNGVVSGTYTAPTGIDVSHSAFVIVRVEDVEVTVFIDIVPAVFGR
jgi:hypothetical protein